SPTHMLSECSYDHVMRNCLTPTDSPLFLSHFPFLLFFFFNDPATTEIYTLSLHDALPICVGSGGPRVHRLQHGADVRQYRTRIRDRKSTRLNSSHRTISYAVFCLKKKKKQMNIRQYTQNEMIEAKQGNLWHERP